MEMTRGFDIDNAPLSYDKRSHAGQVPSLQHFHADGPNHDGLLVEAALQLGTVALPPRMIDLARHDFEHHDVVMRRVAALLPDAFGRRAREAGDAAESLRQLRANPPKGSAIETAACIVGQRKKDLNQMHRHPRKNRHGPAQELVQTKEKARPCLQTASSL